MSTSRIADTGMKQVCLERPSSGPNTTLPAFAAERRCLQHGAHSYRSISSACRALNSKPAGRCCCCRPIGQTDGQTDTRPLHKSFGILTPTLMPDHNHGQISDPPFSHSPKKWYPRLIVLPCSPEESRALYIWR